MTKYKENNISPLAKSLLSLVNGWKACGLEVGLFFNVAFHWTAEVFEQIADWGLLGFGFLVVSVRRLRWYILLVVIVLRVLSCMLSRGWIGLFCKSWFFFLCLTVYVLFDHFLHQGIEVLFLLAFLQILPFLSHNLICVLSDVWWWVALAVIWKVLIQCWDCSWADSGCVSLI